MAILTIIGAGMMGSAMAVPARDNGHEVRIVGTYLDREIVEALRATGEHPKMKRKLPGGIRYYQLEELDAALEGAEQVICGVSSFGVDWFGMEILPKLPEGLPVLSITKGLQLEADGTLLAFPQVLRGMLPGGKTHALCAVGGPCTSYELADRHQTTVAFCGVDREALLLFKRTLETPYYHISITPDVMGLETAVALKNAYALGVTLAIGLAQRAGGIDCVEHYNAEAALFGQSVKEMRGLLRLLGGGDDNIVYGAGDLFVTVFGGRTRLLGTLLGRGLTFDQAMAELDGVTLESVVIARRIAKAIRARAARGEVALAQFPLLMHVDQIISGDEAVNIPWDAFTSIG